jgi:hypothetical protein
MNRPAPFLDRSSQIALTLLRTALVCAVALAWARGAPGQAFVVTGGASSLVDAEGGSLQVNAGNYAGRVDLGYFGKLSTGFFFERPVGPYLFGAGDQQIPFLLPTDIFDRSFYFLGRGGSVSEKIPDGSLFVFAGTTADGFFAPFLNVARADTPAGAIFYEKQLTPTLRFYSRNIFSTRQTAIQAVEWTARKDIKMALSAGIGNNQPYGSSSFSMDEHWMLLDASYTEAGDEFRRVLVATPQLSENDRDNIRFELHPWSTVRFIASRNNYFSYLAPGLFARAAVEGFSGSVGFAGFQTYGSLFLSSTSLGSSTATAFGVRRSITRHFDAGVDYLTSSAAKGPPVHSTVGSLRETLNARFSVNQTITHTQGQTSVDFGGNFISNLVTVSVDYQTLFLPFLTGSKGQFEQVMVLGLHFQLPHGVQFNMDSNVTPLGQIRYSAYATTYAYHGMGSSSNGTSFSGSFFQNVVRGQVHDPDGNPIDGAALQIGTELAITDSEGNFMVRLKKPGMLSLKVDFDDFTVPGRYAIVKAPDTVKAAREDSAEEYEIVLRRLANGVSTADPSHQPDLPDNPPPAK